MSVGAPRGTVRDKTISISVTAEEKEMIMAAAAMEDKYGAEWGRDVLLSRALMLYKQRTWAA